MSTDSKLLELAAKAAGVEKRAPFAEFGQVPYFIRPGMAYEEWTPLTDDGDALRLAVKLRIDLFNYAPPIHECAHVDAVHYRGSSNGSASEELGSDAYAATRRAIVRAAAEIGRAMP